MINVNSIKNINAIRITEMINNNRNGALSNIKKNNKVAKYNRVILKDTFKMILVDK